MSLEREEVDLLRRKRRAFRRHTTKLVNKALELKDSDEVNDTIQIKLYHEQLTTQRNELKELDNKILGYLLEHDDDDDICDKEVEDASEYSEKITKALLIISEILDQKDDAVSVQEDDDVSVKSSSSRTTNRSKSRDSIASDCSLFSYHSDNGKKHVRVKLPQLEIKKFSGRIDEFQEFWDSFVSAIDENEDLANVDKMKYLKGYLDEPARSVIAGVPLSDANYKTAVDLLKKRFAQPRMLEHAHINRLVHIQPVFHEDDVDRLRKFRDQIETNFRGLEALSVDQSTYSKIVVPVLVEKLPKQLKFSMIRSRRKSILEWDLKELIAELDIELEVRESHEDILKFSGRPKREEGRQQPKSKGPYTASVLFTTERRQQCVYCSGQHPSSDCQTHTSPEDRRSILRKSYRCFVCLKPNHKSFECRSKCRCLYCKAKHHASICASIPSKPEIKDAPISDQRNKLNPSAAAWVGSMCSGDTVALQTALANVNDKKDGNVRVLFDSGSHRSFISADAVAKLGLKRVGRERLGIKAFGSKEAMESERDLVEFYLVPLKRGEKRVKILCFVVDNITSITNIHVEQVKKHYPHLQRIYFSDVSRCEDKLDIQILIGADFQWEFMEGEEIRGGPHEPVAIKTTLGWVLSGPLKGKPLASIPECSLNFLPCEPSTRDIDQQVQKLWDLDTLGIRPNDDVHENLIDNIKFTGERYSVSLPWKAGHGHIPLNYDNCYARLQSQVRKFKQDMTIFHEYDRIISDQLDKGIISKVAENNDRVGNVVNVEKFTSLNKLLRVTAWVRRFINNVKEQRKKGELKKGGLEVEEIKKAEKVWIKDAQRMLEESADFEKVKIQLGIVVKNDLLVCQGRLENSDLNLEAKYPIILPKGHSLTQLIVLDCHSKVHHMRVRATLAELRSRFWITKGRQFVKKILKQCFRCRFMDCKPFNDPPTAALPDFRVTEAPPFSTTGIDFAGPLFVKTKGSEMVKSYIVLFTCFITRAVHLELVLDLTTITFVSSLRRFCARRGTPVRIVSDNAKTFKAASKLLYEFVSTAEVENFLLSKRIEWRFNLDRSPWMGGAFERMIGSVKRCLRKVLGNARLMQDELSTVLVEVEATLNSRPLTYQHEEFDSQVLTPSHLLVGRRISPLSDYVDKDLDYENDDYNVNLSRRFIYLTRKLSHFWKRWRSEYLSGLREVHRLRPAERNIITEGEIVIVRDENNPKRNAWKVAIVEKLIQGKDGEIRGAQVRRVSAKGKPETLIRPVQKLYPLEISCSDVRDESKNREKSREEMVDVNEVASERDITARPSRAAALDARWKSQLMLDP